MNEKPSRVHSDDNLDLIRNQRKCEWCGDKVPLDAHHIKSKGKDLRSKVHIPVPLGRGTLTRTFRGTLPSLGGRSRYYLLRMASDDEIR